MIIYHLNKFESVNVNTFQDMRAIVWNFDFKKLSESRATVQNQGKGLGARWTSYIV